MQTQTARRPIRPTTPADLRRLAAQGAANGVCLFTEAATGARFASSATEAGTIYYVTGVSCTCAGFLRHQRCQHHSLLLQELGWLPDVEAAPVPVVVCPACGGRGVDPACHGHSVPGGVVTCPCERCQGASHVAPTITTPPARLAA